MVLADPVYTMDDWAEAGGPGLVTKPHTEATLSMKDFQGNSAGYAMAFLMSQKKSGALTDQLDGSRSF